MDRRTFVVALASLAAGCATDGGDATTTTTPTQTPSTTTSTPSPTTTTETPTTAEPTTTTETPTATPDEQAAQYIDDATAKIEAAAEEYASYGAGGTDVASVTATADGFTWTTVANRVGEAGRLLSQAEKTATESQRDTISRLRGLVNFLLYGARCQFELIDADQSAATVIDQMSETTLDAAGGDRVDRIRTHRQNATQYLSTLRDRSRSRDTRAVSFLTVNQYVTVTENLQTELDTVDVVTGVLLTLDEAYRLYREADRRSNYDQATQAEDQFRSALTTLDDHTPAESMSARIDSLTELTTAWVEKTEELRRDLD
ncbi:MAG: hypothetical protein ABEJ30_03735 [Halorientalis sp.]